MISQASQEQKHAPTLLALRTISEARRTLEEVVTSSESFDYIRAKEGLKKLQRIIRELGREEARLRASALQTPHCGCAEVLPFPMHHDRETAGKQPDV